MEEIESIVEMQNYQGHSFYRIRRNKYSESTWELEPDLIAQGHITKLHDFLLESGLSLHAKKLQRTYPKLLDS